MADRDFDEQEVWSVLATKEKPESPYKGKKSSRESSIPRRVEHMSCSSSIVIRKSTNNPEMRIVQQSVPVSIPDWSMIYKKGRHSNVDDHGDGDGRGGAEKEEDDDRMPPHELMARKLARNHITSSSVYEGAGRTLKGRDLSKVRHEVLTSTGFVE